MAAYNQVNGTTMTECPLLRDVLKDEWGFDGVVMSDWYAARSTARPATPRSTWSCPGPTGPWGDALVAGRPRRAASREASVDDKVLRLLRLAARVGALAGVDAAAPPAHPWTDERDRRRAARRRRGRLRAGAQRGRAAAAGARGRCARVAVLGPNAATARTLGRRQRDGLPALRRVAARRPARRARCRRRACSHVPGVRAHDRAIAAARAGRLLAARPRSASSTPTARCWAPSSAAPARLHLARLLRRGRGGARGRGRRGPRACAPPRPASTVIGASGRRALPADGRRRARPSTSSSSCRRAPTRSRAMMRPPQHGVRSCSTAGQEVDVSLAARRRAPAGGADTSLATCQLDVELPASRRRRRARARRGRWPRTPTSRSSSSAPPRRSRARASTATSLALPGPPGRARPPRRGGQPAHRRRRQRGRTGAAAVGRRGRRDPADLVPGPGVRPRARRRAARATPSRADGCRPRGRPRPTGCPPTHAGRRDAHLRRGHASSATAPTSATGATPLFPSATASATPAGSTWRSTCDAEGVQVTVRNTGRAARARGRRRSTRRGPTARSTARRSGSWASGRPRSSRARRRPCASR